MRNALLPLRCGGGGWRGGAGGEVAGAPRVAVVVEGPMHRWESDVVPRDLVPGEERDFEAFGARGHGVVEEARAVDQLDLADPRNVVDREEPLDLNLCLGLLPGLALGPGAR